MTTELRALDAPALVKAARAHAGFSQVALGRRVGTTQSTVSRWESGRDEPSLRTLAAVLDACGLQASVTVAPPDAEADRSQIRQQLAMSPEQRLASVANVSRLRTRARRA